MSEKPMPTPGRLYLSQRERQPEFFHLFVVTRIIWNATSGMNHIYIHHLAASEENMRSFDYYSLSSDEMKLGGFYPGSRVGFVSFKEV